MSRAIRRVADNQSGTREQILAAAGALFTERGYDGSSMQAIASKVGITPPALYWHFESKDALFYAFLEELLTSSVEYVFAAVEVQASPPDRLRQFAAAHVRFQLEERESNVAAYGSLFGLRQLLTALPLKQRRPLVDLQRRYTDRLRDILAAGIAAGTFQIENTTVTVYALISMWEYAFTWFDPLGRLSIEEVAEYYARLSLRVVGHT